MSDDEIYDRAEFHIGEDFPEDLPEDQAFVHTGMYLGWIIDRSLYSDQFGEDMSDDIAAFRSGALSGPQIYARCDGALVGDMLNEAGNAFSQAYFDLDQGEYLKDFHELLARDLPSLYHVADSRESYDLLKTRIDQRYEEWKRRRGKRFWELWR